MIIILKKKSLVFRLQRLYNHKYKKLEKFKEFLSKYLDKKAVKKPEI